MKQTLIKISAGAAAFAPMAAFAANDLGQISTFFKNVLDLVNGTLIPLMFAIAILAFFWGVFKYLIVGGGDESKRAEGRQLMLWAILGFVVMVSLYGIISLVSGAIGIPDEDSGSVTLPTAPTGDSNSGSGRSGSSFLPPR